MAHKLDYSHRGGRRQHNKRRRFVNFVPWRRKWKIQGEGGKRKSKRKNNTMMKNLKEVRTRRRRQRRKKQRNFLQRRGRSKVKLLSPKRNIRKIS